MKKFEIFNADAYQKINDLINMGIKVDHIITDPPYNISQNNNFHTMKNPRIGIDFGTWDRGSFDLYSWIPLYAKLLKVNSSMIIFCSYRFISYIIDVIESDSTNMIVKDVLVWQKSNPMPRNVNRRYVQDMEFAIWAVKKKSKWVFNKPNEQPYLRACFKSPLVSGKEKQGHPTQKSLRLMEDIISIHTNSNELILDPFMGSGTTGVACLKCGRRFLGIELEKDYFGIAKERLESL